MIKLILKYKTMNLSELKKEVLKMIDMHPKHTEELRELYFLALSEVEDGGSEPHECELAYNDMLEVING
jgi:hypothetical protein